jgi:hypothetical protein
MGPFLYRCPNTLLLVQGWSADDASESEGEAYQTVVCTACQQIHFVNQATGKMLGADDK